MNATILFQLVAIENLYNLYEKNIIRLFIKIAIIKVF